MMRCTAQVGFHDVGLVDAEFVTHDGTQWLTFGEAQRYGDGEKEPNATVRAVVYGGPIAAREFVRKLVSALEAGGALTQPAAVNIRAILDGVDLEAGASEPADLEARALGYALRRNGGGA